MCVCMCVCARVRARARACVRAHLCSRSPVCQMKRMATQRHVLDSAAAEREERGDGQQSGNQLFEALDAQVGVFGCEQAR